MGRPAGSKNSLKPGKGARPPRPLGRPKAADRWLCPGCWKMRPVDGDVIEAHEVAASYVSRERTECPGSGKPGSGRVIHGADVVTTNLKKS